MTESQKRRALIVNDNPVIRLLTEELMKELGFECLSAEEGEDALEILGGVEEGLDVIITDLQMPVMDGLTFIATLRSNPAFARFSGVPILIMTATPKEQLEGHPGGLDIITLPLTSEELSGKIIKTGVIVNPSRR